MINVPVFQSHFEVTHIHGEGLLLRGERNAFALRGHVFEKLAPLIDGRRSAKDIVAVLSTEVKPAVAWYALMQMESQGYISESHPGIDRQTAAFWSVQDAAPETVVTALAAAPVRIFSVGPSCADRLQQALAQFRITSTVCKSLDAETSDVSNSGLDVVLAHDYLCEGLSAFDEAARRSGRQWLLVRPGHIEVWIGPLFAPGETGCLHCLQRRHRRLRHARVRTLSAHHQAVEAPETLPAVAEMTYLMVAMEVARWLGGTTSRLSAGTALSIDVSDWSSRTHRLGRDPCCRACGRAPEGGGEAPALRLRPTPVGFDADGGYRSVPPERTLAAFEHLISPITGIVGFVESSPRPDGLGRTWIADDVAGTLLQDSLLHVIEEHRTASSGKGVSDAQAKASALCEVVERYSGARHGTERLTTGSFRELGADAIHPGEVLLFSDRQYRERRHWNARLGGQRHFVPEPFDPDVRIDWTPVWSLTHQRHRLLPTQLLYYRGLDSPRESMFARGDSNGCASGNTLEEAVLQGLLELIERDATALWWYNRLRRPTIDTSSFDDPFLHGIEARYEALGRGLAILDLTSDLGIPVVTAVAYRRHGPPGKILAGFGCHLDPRLAVQRALTETNQLLHNDREMDIDETACRQGGWLCPDETTTPRVRDDFPDHRQGDLMESIELCRRRVEALGTEVLVLDQTRADIGLPVVRVLVPGLRHSLPRFAPGRLYDVPVRMGWLPVPPTEEGLNPVPFLA